MYFFVILYLSIYMHGRSFFMLCIGKCVGSLSIYGGGLGCYNDSGGGRWVWCSCDLMRML